MRLVRALVPVGPTLMVLALAGCADWVTDVPPYGSIDVLAHRRSGEPVAGASLLLYNGSRVMARGTTGTDGGYRFEYLPTGAYGVYAEPPAGYERPEAILGGPPITVVDSGLVLGEGGHGAAAFTYLKVGPGAVDVLLNADDAPLGGVEASLYNPTGVHSIAATDGAGRAHFEGVPFGAWGVSFALPRAYLDLDETALFIDGIVVEEGVRSAVEATARRCEGSVRVSVRGPSATPATGHQVLLYDVSGVLARSAAAGDGLATFAPVPCGEYGVRLDRTTGWTFAEGRGTSYVDGLRVGRDGGADAAFTVLRCSGVIRVDVRDGSGAAVAGAGLTLYDERGFVAQAASDAQGTASFTGVGCGSYGVGVQPPAGFSVATGRGSSFFDGIEVSDGGQRTVTFTLTRS